MVPRLLALLSRFSPNSVGTWTHNGLIDASGAAGGQIKFPATQNASADVNTLDDYEEGTWTPSVGGSATYTTQTATYTKVGNTVFFAYNLAINLIGTGSTTVISGLPFSCAAGSPGYYHAIAWTTAANTFVNVIGQIAAASSSITMLGVTGATATVSSATAVLGNGTTVVGTGFYKA